MVFPNPRVFFSQLKMVKLHHFHITVQEYHRWGKGNLFPDLYGCPNPCCCYEGRLRRHGFFYRNTLTLTATYVIVIQRYYCPVCKKTVSLLPSFLAPRFQYSLACIFYVLYQRLVNHLPLALIAIKVNLASGRTEMAYQHVCFYCNRLLKNRPLITGFLGSEGIILAAADPASWAKAFILAVSSGYQLEPFSLLYFAFQTRHFLSKS